MVSVWARGIPKLPRINPGTILNNSRLIAMLSEEETMRFNTMANDELWTLEEKYDVDVLEMYGNNSIAQQAVLKHLVILNWNRKRRRNLQN